MRSRSDGLLLLFLCLAGGPFMDLIRDGLAMMCFFCVLFQRVKGGDWGRSPQQAAKGTWVFERSEKRTMYLFALLADSRTRRTINKIFSILRAEKKGCSEIHTPCNVRLFLKKTKTHICITFTYLLLYLLSGTMPWDLSGGWSCSRIWNDNLICRSS